MRGMTELAVATVDVRCRWRAADVTVRMLTDDGWHPVEILSCSAFQDPTALACGTPCLAEAAACHHRGTSRTAGPGPRPKAVDPSAGPLEPRPDRTSG